MRVLHTVFVTIGITCKITYDVQEYRCVNLYYAEVN